MNYSNERINVAVGNNKIMKIMINEREEINFDGRNEREWLTVSEHPPEKVNKNKRPNAFEAVNLQGQINGGGSRKRNKLNQSHAMKRKEIYVMTNLELGVM